MLWMQTIQTSRRSSPSLLRLSSKTTATIAAAVLNFSTNNCYISPTHSFLLTTIGFPKPNFHHQQQQQASHSLSSYHRRKSTASTSMAMNMIHGKTFVSVEDAFALHPSSSSSSSSSEKSDKNVVFVDGSWFLPTLGRNGKEEFLEGPRIEGAKFLDIDDIATPTTSEGGQQLPHMMPSNDLFSKWMDTMEITTNDHVIVYGSKECPFVSRAFWNVRTFHPPNQCHLLDGSLQDWIDANGPIEEKGTEPKCPIVTASQLSSSSLEPKYKPRSIDPKNNIVDLDKVKQSIENGSVVKNVASGDDSSSESMVIVDARSNGRFIAVADEPRPGLREGHMPGKKNSLLYMACYRVPDSTLDGASSLYFSYHYVHRPPSPLKKTKGAINIPFNSLLQESNVNRYLPREDLVTILEKNGLVSDNGKGNKTRIVSSCGSGVTASCLLVALTSVIGPDRVDDVAYLYDGSWIEWGGDKDTPVVTED
mmetsp:Transcript_52665/g.127685  ORF Transcript_52665/g.127685 Transcript_52665/m.127685 type:complete len:478 (+) Transcript_52665:33-1466(+)